MKLLVASDLHFEFHADGGRAWVKSMPDADVFVCAGDLSDARGLEKSLWLLCKRWPKVVFVCGNHEFYGRSIGRMRHRLQNLRRELTNLYYLDNEVCEIAGQRFVGTTLWFEDGPENERLQPHMNDFQTISDASTQIYKENEKALAFLQREVDAQSIVITHHLPSNQCVAPKFHTSPLNVFFVCDVEGLIVDRQPSLWIHGHTHESVDIKIGKTRVVCNPFGYAGLELNENFKEDLLLEV